MKRGGVRILGGALQGRRLDVPATARPTESRVREALFSIWGHDVGDCRFLDLFAGSGAVGLEAVSRGAASATFVECAKAALACLRRNLRLADDSGQLGDSTCRLVPSRLPRIPGALKSSHFDLAFADPPYDYDGYGSLLHEVRPLIEEGGELVIEHATQATLPASAGWESVSTRRYGTSCLTFFRPLPIAVSPETA